MGSNYSPKYPLLAGSNHFSQSSIAAQHIRMEAIRRQEQRLYEAKKAQEQSKTEGLKLGLPGKDRWKPQLFRKDYPNPKLFTGKINEKDFVQMMKTNDRFKGAEDHEGIERRKNSRKLDGVAVAGNANRHQPNQNH